MSAQVDYVSGGYFIVRPSPREEWMTAEILPDTILSVSGCVVELLPGFWTLPWAKMTDEERMEDASEVGIPRERTGEVMAWVRDALDRDLMGWVDVFYSLSRAREFASRFLTNTQGLSILGIALSRAHAPGFLDYERPATDEDAPGVYKMIEWGRSLEAGGEPLGFDILGDEDGHFHTWLCNHLDVKVHRKFGIRPNAVGFIENPDDADKAAEYCAREDVGSEPVLWRPWLISQYGLEEPSPQHGTMV